MLPAPPPLVQSGVAAVGAAHLPRAGTQEPEWLRDAVDRLAAAVVHAPRDDPAEPDWLLAAAAELSEASYAPPVPRAEGKEAKVVGVEIQTQTSPAEVCHTDLEPQTSRPQAGLLLTPLGLALDSRLPSPSPSTRR